jgi:hypothetical protein
MHGTLLTRRASLAVAVTGATLALATPAAFAQAGAANADTVALQSRGSTSLTIDKGTAQALAKLRIAVAPVKPAKVSKGAVSFPITGGSLDPAKVAPAQINHSGGLRLSRGKTKVNLLNFRIRVDLNGAATLSAAVGGNARATIMDLDLSKAKISRPRVGGPLNIATRVSRVGVDLNRTGAAALNSAFKTTAFKRGLRVGTAVVNALPSQLIIESGSTALTPDDTTIGVLTGAGITPGLVEPATPQNGAFAFPITRSVIRADATSGTIGHTGGISLTRAPTAVTLTNFDINLGAAPTLAASVNGGAKAAIADLDLTKVLIRASGTTGLIVSGVTVNLNQAASDALAGAFPGLPPTAGAELGTVVVTAQAR